jgi:hypothetical protein
LAKLSTSRVKDVALAVSVTEMLAALELELDPERADQAVAAVIALAASASAENPD